MSLPNTDYGRSASMDLEHVLKYAVMALLAAVALHGLATVMLGGIRIWEATRGTSAWALGYVNTGAQIGSSAVAIIAGIIEVVIAFILFLPLLKTGELPSKDEVLSGTGIFMILHYLVLAYFLLLSVAWIILGAYLPGISLLLATIFLAMTYMVWRGIIAFPPMVTAILLIIGSVLFSIYGFASRDVALGMFAGVLGLNLLFIGIYYLISGMGIRNPAIEKATYYIAVLTGETGFIVGGIAAFIAIADSAMWSGGMIAVSVFILLYGIAALIGGLIALLYTLKEAFSEISAGAQPPATGAPAPATPPPPPPPPPSS